MGQLSQYKHLVQTKIFSFFKEHWENVVYDRTNGKETSMECSFVLPADTSRSTKTTPKKRKIEISEAESRVQKRHKDSGHFTQD